jgi:hypothetical protein
MPAPPGGFSDYHLKQPALFCGGLLQEQFARPARQPQHIDGLINRGRHGRLDVLYLAEQTVLLPAPSGRLLVEKVLGDATVEFVNIHGLDARLDLVVPSLQIFDGLRAGRLLGPVRGEHSVTEPVQDRLRNDQFLKDVGELAGEDFLAGIWLRAFSSVASAVIVDVLAFF